ncbi:MAG TPA: hypothetical protein PLB89_13785 [Flavobacteriales bacterium]|nr:hypothetical protein [Flavobacteriales bacterium]
MKILAIALLATPLWSVAQTTHPIEIGGSTSSDPAPYYSPQFLTIPVGDRVRWTNMSGTHNVNGTFELFPANPAEFDSGDPENGMWSYLFTFDIPGVYNYRCESEGHAETQFGTITVEGTNGLRNSPIGQRIIAFPSPAVDFVWIDVGRRQFATAEVVMLDGRVVATHAVNGGDLLTVPIATLRSGNYTLRLTGTNDTPATVRFTKQ